jgi:hypothetical protein
LLCNEGVTHPLGVNRMVVAESQGQPARGRLQNATLRDAGQDKRLNVTMGLGL